MRLGACDESGKRLDLIRFGDGEVFARELDMAAGRPVFKGLLMGAGNVTIDMMYYPDINSWNGRESLQYIVKDFRARR